MNLFELFVKIGVDDQASKEINSVGQSVEEAGGRGESAAAKIGNGFKQAAKITVAAFTAASVALSAITASAVKEYAEYEQLIGGVETLFGESSDKLEEYASNAYKTAGLSLNEYMSTVTSFSASLIQSLGGDTEAAAEYADRALTDMSDNANKLGSDMSTIQNAYQGFAKQNYTMLDNLKLGYSGSKTEMQRLIKDAANLTDVQKELGVTVDANSMSFANIVNAISVVQSNMGILGTTSKEAATTVSGSIKSMGAAWKNILVGIADDTADFDKLIDDFITTIVGENEGEGVIANLAPRVTTAFNGISKLIKELAPRLIELIPQIIGDVGPSVIDSFFSIIDSVITFLDDPENSEEFMNSAIGLIESFILGLIDRADDIVEVGIQLITTFLQSLAGNESAKKIASAAVKMILTLAEMLTNPDNSEDLISAGIEIVVQLIAGILEGISDPKQAENIIVNLIGSLVKVPINIVSSLFNSLVDNIFSGLISSVKESSDDQGFLKALFDKLFAGPFNIGKNIAVRVLLEIIEGLQKIFPNWNFLNNAHSTVESWISDGNESPSGTDDRRHPRATSDDYSNYESAISESTTKQDGQSGGKTTNINVTQNIYSPAKTEADLMKDAIEEQERAVLNGV